MPRSTYTTTLPIAYDDALEVLGADPALVLQEATDRASAGTDTIVRPLTCELAGFALARDVAIEVEPLVPAELLRASLPLRWRAARGASWFPTVEGTLEVATTHGDPGRTTLTLRVEHRPPLGPAGTLVDRTLARRVTASTLERFLGELAGRLQELVATTELSSDLRIPPPLGPPTDTSREVRFDPEAPVRTALHGDDVHQVTLVGFEPWQSTTLPAHDATVTVIVLAGRGRLTLGRTVVELEAGEVEVIPAGADASLGARGQRMTVVEHVVAVTSPTVPVPLDDDPVVVVTA